MDALQVQVQMHVMMPLHPASHPSAASLPHMKSVSSPDSSMAVAAMLRFSARPDCRGGGEGEVRPAQAAQAM
jgi:hypothetical protein